MANVTTIDARTGQATTRPETAGEAAARAALAAAVQAREAADAQAASDDDADRATIRAGLAALASDRALMLGAGTPADVKAALARLDGAFIALARVLARRGMG